MPASGGGELIQSICKGKTLVTRSRAVKKVLWALKDQIQARDILIFSDNATVVAYLSAVHKWTLNILADYLSRVQTSSNWEFNSEVSRDHDEMGGARSGSLCLQAEQESANLLLPGKKIFSPGHGLIQHLNFKLGYAFPPIVLLPLVARKIVQDQVEWTLVAPWGPRWSWFSALLVFPPWILLNQWICNPRDRLFIQTCQIIWLTAWGWILKNNFR